MIALYWIGSHYGQIKIVVKQWNVTRKFIFNELKANLLKIYKK